MEDSEFIREMLQKGLEAKNKVITEFSGMTSLQLNWKLTLENWSIGQCLDHLIVSNRLYFPALKKITGGQYIMTIWERWGPFSKICGRILKDNLKEEVKKKMKAPKVLLPSVIIDTSVLESFHKHLDSFLDFIAGCEKVNIDRIIISSPAIKFVTYSLRDAITFLIQHEHRHINQAIRVKRNERFPK
jgi:uncharacterized damage-inducible protein DinB